jgi:hypothetical protein
MTTIFYRPDKRRDKLRTQRNAEDGRGTDAHGNNPWAGAGVRLGFAAAIAGGATGTTKQRLPENSERG